MVQLKDVIDKKILKEVDKSYASEQLNPKLKRLVKSLDLDEKECKSNLSSLLDTLSELDNCASCPGLNNCPNHLKGYVYYPKKDESKVTFNYIPCKKLKKFEKDLETKEGSYEIASARIKDIDSKDKKRHELIKWILNFYDKYDKAKENKGLYLHGSFGSGKTFLLAALLNELHSEKNASIEIVYLPELLRSLKDDFNLLESKLRYLSNVDILLLDDIGAEKVTDWSRDEILGTILQARMNNKMTTFFTSNLTIEELEKHLSLSKDSTDVVKARRIIERIKQLTEDMELVSMNRRK